MEAERAFIRPSRWNHNRDDWLASYYSISFVYCWGVVVAIQL